MSKPKIGDAAVRKATGKGWSEWFRILDREKSKTRSHREITDILYQKHVVGPWWSQMVTVSYEQQRGMRAPHEKADGFAASISRTISAPIDELYTAWNDAKRRARWLKKSNMTVRRSTENKSMRIGWPDDTNVEVNFYPKGAGKSQVTVQHSKLPSKGQVGEKKTFWSEALERLKEQLEG